MKPFQLSRNAFGKLVFSSPDDVEVHEGVVPVRAFPIAAPDEGIALVDTHGRELAWIDSLDDVPAAARALIEEELANRDFLPEIRRIAHVSTFASPSDAASPSRRMGRSCASSPFSSAGTHSGKAARQPISSGCRPAARNRYFPSGPFTSIVAVVWR